MLAARFRPNQPGLAELDRRGFPQGHVAEETTSRRAARLGAFGDLPTRFLIHALPRLPWFLESALLRMWTGLFFLIAAEQRRAVAHNLRALHPGWSPLRAVHGAWRVFLNFAATYLDATRCETETGGVDWEIVGLETFEDLANRKDGCILLTAHMGNYDLAAPMFSTRFKRTLYAVRAPEREPEMQRIREQELRRKEARHPNFRILYNTADGMLGVELARLLREGSIVAVQGDRVMFDVAPMDCEVRPGLHMRLPKGPLFLARATGAPCFPVFITRRGWRRYRVTVLPPLDLPGRRRGNDDEATRIWADAVFDFASRHWDQWFVFEKMLDRVPSEG